VAAHARESVALVEHGVNRAQALRRAPTLRDLLAPARTRLVQEVEVGQLLGD
jgi:hypothetical protein